MTAIKKFIIDVDDRIITVMDQISKPAIRFSLGVIFIWFGILKPLGLSAAEELLKATVQWLPFGSPDVWLNVIGWWEVLIGILFLSSTTTRIAIALLFAQMVGTFMPLVFLPKVTFQADNFLLPTMEGQYIIKNLVIISSALVLGGQFQKSKKED